jgi:hypothetical protein
VAVLALFKHPDWSRLNTIGIAIFGWIALMPLTVGYLAWFRALRYVPALGDPFGPWQVVALTPTGVAMAAIT